MNTNKNIEYVSIENFKDLLQQFTNFLYDVHKINIENVKDINFKELIFNLMEKINTTTHAKNLNTKELNIITLKTLRDYLKKNNKELFENKKQVSILNREQSISNKKVNIPVNFEDNNTNRPSRDKLVNEYNNYMKDRTYNIEDKKKNIDFEFKKDTILNKTEFSNKLNELEQLRNDPSMKIEQPKTDKMPDDKIETNFEQNNLIPTNTNIESFNENNLNHDLNMDNLDELKGFNMDTIDDNFGSYSFESDTPDTTPNTIPNTTSNNTSNNTPNNTPNTIPNNNKIVDEDKLIENLYKENQNQNHNHNNIKKQKLIISSIKRDTDLYPSATEYIIPLKSPIHNITKIKLVNSIIKINKIKNNINFLIFKLNNFNMISSNDTNINESFAILSDNKLYDDEIIFNPPLENLEEFNINILNKYGKSFNDDNNNIFEFIIEFL